MEKMKSAGMLSGRLLLSLIFLVSGVSKVFNFAGTAKYMSSHGMHAVHIWLVIAILFEVAGAISLMGGIYTRMGALLLILFIIPVTLIFHWEPGNRLQSIMFMKNLSIMGGLMMVMCAGPGRFSVDELRKKNR